MGGSRLREVLSMWSRFSGSEAAIPLVSGGAFGKCGLASTGLGAGSARPGVVDCSEKSVESARSHGEGLRAHVLLAPFPLVHCDAAQMPAMIVNCLFSGPVWKVSAVVGLQACSPLSPSRSVRATALAARAGPREDVDPLFASHPPPVPRSAIGECCGGHPEQLGWSPPGPDPPQRVIRWGRRADSEPRRKARPERRRLLLHGGPAADPRGGPARAPRSGGLAARAPRRGRCHVLPRAGAAVLRGGVRRMRRDGAAAGPPGGDRPPWRLRLCL